MVPPPQELARVISDRVDFAYAGMRGVGADQLGVAHGAEAQDAGAARGAAEAPPSAGERNPQRRLSVGELAERHPGALCVGALERMEEYMRPQPAGGGAATLPAVMNNYFLLASGRG